MHLIDLYNLTHIHIHVYGHNYTMLTVSNGIISTIAGTGANMRYPTGVALDSVGNVYVATAGDNIVRKVYI